MDWEQQCAILQKRIDELESEKTVVAAYLMEHRKVNTLILVHTQALMNQWKKSSEAF